MRSHYCQDVNESLVGKEVALCGWVHRRRDHGGLLFVDLRDRSGLVQIVCNPSVKAVFDIAETLRNEYVVKVSGNVCHRPQGTINPNLDSGEVEVAATAITLFNKSSSLPFNVDEYQEVGEEVRLKYRYLDLRRPEVAKRLKMRSHITQYIRHFFNEQGFFDIETP